MPTIHPSRSQKALAAIVLGQEGDDPVRSRLRKALKDVCHRSTMWEYAKGVAIPSAPRAAKIEKASEGRVPANGWDSDEPHSTAATSAPADLGSRIAELSTETGLEEGLVDLGVRP